MPTNFIHSAEPVQGIQKISETVVSHLATGKKVLWLVPGGSNISAAVSIMNAIRKETSPVELSTLTVSLTDERYGQVGHSDSNWKQLIDAGFNFNGIETIPVLVGSSFEDTIKQYGVNISKAMESSDITIGLFGMGADGHIAGVLPYTPGVASTDSAVGYKTETFARITLTLNTLKRINEAFLFAFGESKRKAVNDLEQGSSSLDEQPAGVLKNIGNAWVYSDQT